MTCPHWSDANHTYFQIANLFLAFSFLVPDTLKGLFALRLFLGTARFFFTLWAGIILCSPDTLGWNLAFMIVNYMHVAYLLWKMRPIKLEEEHELIYTGMFEMLGVARWQYKILAGAGEIRELVKEEAYAEENTDDGLGISVIVYGNVRVTKNGKLIHRLKPYEFLDSPEWIASTQGGGAVPITFEVSLTSEGCVIITWQRNTLLKILRRQPYLKNIFDSIIGQDVAKKLFKSNQKINDEKAGQSAFIYDHGDNHVYNRKENESIPLETMRADSANELTPVLTENHVEISTGNNGYGTNGV